MLIGTISLEINKRVTISIWTCRLKEFHKFFNDISEYSINSKCYFFTEKKKYT